MGVLPMNLSKNPERSAIGLPDKERGERVTAFIIPRPGKTFDKNALHSYLKLCLSPFKVPKEYRLVKDFPKRLAGKILKRELRKAAAEIPKDKSS